MMVVEKIVSSFVSERSFRTFESFGMRNSIFPEWLVTAALQVTHIPISVEVGYLMPWRLKRHPEYPSLSIFIRFITKLLPLPRVHRLCKYHIRSLCTFLGSTPFKRNDTVFLRFRHAFLI